MWTVVLAVVVVVPLRTKADLRSSRIDLQGDGC